MKWPPDEDVILDLERVSDARRALNAKMQDSFGPRVFVLHVDWPLRKRFLRRRKLRRALRRLRLRLG